MRERLLNVMTLVACVSSIGMAGMAVHRNGPSQEGGSTTIAATPVRDWDRYVTTARHVGSQNARLVIVEFADFQCPACRAMHAALQRLREEYPEDVRIAFHYFPLAYHKRAYDAARAAECANDQGRFAQMHDALYAHFADLDTISLARLASEQGLPNMRQFVSCVALRDKNPVIERDLSLGRDTLRITGTPTFIINGNMYQVAPRFAELEGMAAAAKRARLKL
jgi:protein-disulfide isomerase